MPELSDPEWLPLELRRVRRSRRRCQEMAENNVDFAHFRYVHGTDAIPEDEFFIDGTYKRTVGADGNFVREGFGLGLGVLRIKGYIDVPLLDDADRRGERARALDLHRARRERRRRRASRPPSASRAGVSQDIPIWENKIYRRPAGADEEREEACSSNALGQAVLFELRPQRRSRADGGLKAVSPRRGGRRACRSPRSTPVSMPLATNASRPSKLSTSDVAVSRVRPSPRSSKRSVSRATPSGTPSKVNVWTMSSFGTTSWNEPWKLASKSSRAIV